MGRSTSFGIYVEDEEDHLIKSVTFTDSKGFLYGPYTSMSSLYDIINLKTINFPIGEEPPFDDVSFFYKINKLFSTLQIQNFTIFQSDCFVNINNKWKNKSNHCMKNVYGLQFEIRYLWKNEVAS